MTAVKPDKTRWPLVDARAAGTELLLLISSFCERVEVAGSMRRNKPLVGDIELLFVPTIETMVDPYQDFFASQTVNQTDRALDKMLRAGILEKRVNVKGQTSWGPKIKLALHKESGIPVDLFAVVPPDTWWNYLVCRTGPKASNERIAEAAQAKGWKWKPYSVGFCELENGQETQTFHAVKSEQEVFQFVGLPYQEPWERK